MIRGKGQIFSNQQATNGGMGWGDAKDGDSVSKDH